MSRRYFGKVDYDDSNKYIKKEIHYNGDTIIYVNVTDIRKNVVCDKCGKQMEPRGKGSRVYCDIKDGSENDWKILYVSYEYTREYTRQLLEEQMDFEVDAVTGASTSGGNFVRLVHAALEQAEKGDSATVIVESY